MKDKGKEFNFNEYKKFLLEIGYLKNQVKILKFKLKMLMKKFQVFAGPQLVCPVMNERYLLNAANARWMSLYDSLYGTDIIETKDALKGKTYIILLRK